MTLPAAPARLAWGIWSLAAAFYFIGFFHRVAPAVITGELMTEFAIGAAAMGNLSALYFYSYVAMQIPTGVLTDRWGPRRVMAAGALVAACGIALFAMAPTLAWAGVGRLLLGASVGVAWVGMLKLASHWLPPRRFGLASGMLLLVGIIGAVSAGVPLRLLVAEFGWRPVILASGLLTAALGIAIWKLVRDDPTEKGYASHCPTVARSTSEEPRPSALQGLKEVMGYRNTRLLFLIPAGMVGGVLAFGGLWGVPFLSTHYAMTTAEAAGMTSLLLVAFGLGGPAWGSASDYLGRRKQAYVTGVALAVAGWAAIIFGPLHSKPLLAALLAATGFASGVMIISFPFVKESVPPRLAGTAAGVVNMGVLIGPMVLQPAVGWVLDRNWQGTLSHGARVYDLAAYRWGFALMLAWAVVSLVLVLFTRETHCRQQEVTTVRREGA